jgi:hypothetical protein
LENVLALVIVDGVLGEEAHEFVGIVLMKVADVAESAETIKRLVWTRLCDEKGRELARRKDLGAACGR